MKLMFPSRKRAALAHWAGCVNDRICEADGAIDMKVDTA
jgi:hypothetical protein